MYIRNGGHVPSFAVQARLFIDLWLQCEWRPTLNSDEKMRKVVRPVAVIEYKKYVQMRLWLVAVMCPLLQCKRDCL